MPTRPAARRATTICMHCCAMRCCTLLARACTRPAIACGVTLDHDRPWPYKPYTVRALQKTYGPMWVRRNLCRRYAHLRLTGLLDVDYRTKRFSWSRCGSEAWV